MVCGFSAQKLILYIHQIKLIAPSVCIVAAILPSHVSSQRGKEDETDELHGVNTGS